VIDDALAAPSWSNTQPYRLAVASGDRADRIRDGLARRIADGVVPDSDFEIPLAYPEDLQERRRATGFGLYEVLGIERSDRAARDRQMLRNFEFFGAPTAIFAFVHEGLGAYSVLDAGFMLQTLLLSAHVRGLGTCAQGALAVWTGPVRAEFEVPEVYRLVCGVSIGYASHHPVNEFAPGRPAVDDVLLPPRARC
jgi:nitroreductase